ncbi:MAG: DUF2333 family protein [Desulfosarcinaceae bacterium]|nr:DUF2333 family protein [Desulfosarcinaceae bacterium]
MTAYTTERNDTPLPETPLKEEEHLILDNVERLWTFRKIILGLVAATVILCALVMFAWSRQPRVFDVMEMVAERTGLAPEETGAGVATTVAVIGTAEVLLKKQGGYLRNDRFPPGWFLDNIPSWEFGVVTELRDAVRTMRNDFGRAQSQSVEDPDLMLAEAQFFFDDNSWILPATEGEYRKGIVAMERYLQRLTDDVPSDGLFFARSDNLQIYLAVVEKRLGNFAQRLSSSVRGLRFQDDPTNIARIRDSLLRSGELQQRTPWLEVDNVFFEARGYVWALFHTLQGIEKDFHDILVSRSALGQLHRILHKLELALTPVFSPVILNRSGFGIFTNHSLVLASYVSRANSAIIDLRLLLSE